MRNDLPARVERAEVEIVVLDGAFDLERLITGKKHVGRVRGDHFDRCGDPVGCRVFQEIHDFFLIGRGCTHRVVGLNRALVAFSMNRRFPLRVLCSASV